ncbi:mannitol dehydrogenase family protein [Roseivivax sediminis]|uniref:Mannitol 2-dehydrogenase n=1 Tax=Roseivivax sediminis TaxID=936889 RepID=A0A1I2DB55_9RHOB|nr:mannitol dehydrogenase family protein [Roseivivax sediminis]SFE77785.1 mannitol 2-dehydrogenase [Roseivivax sediminis]
MAIPLSLATLPDLPPAVGLPDYAREDLSAGILHVGVGNFHRAHQVAYLDRLFSAGKGRDFAIVGAGIMEADRKARDTLAAQDWFSTLVEQSAEASDARVTGVMIDYVEPADQDAITRRMAAPDIRIVSLTITEGGYFLDSSGHFDADHPAIAADAAAPDAPRTVFGMILKALRLRRHAGLPPFTVMSCDNIPHNGVVTRDTLSGLAALTDNTFAEWVRDNVAFPNGMVDRITPATSDRERALLRDTHGVEDGWPVFAEDFIQWVLEDNFPQGRPPLEDVGVEFVEDVTPFEAMKIRILNGGHAIIAYPAGLMGIHFVHEAMENDLVARFLDKVEREEILPGVPPVPNTDTGAYLEKIKERFANPKIGDTVRRLCLDGSNRQPKFILLSLADALARGGAIDGLALESALWCRYCAGTTDTGETIAPNDPNWNSLQPVALAARERPQAWLEQRAIYGALGDEPRLREAFGRWLSLLWSEGTEATLRTYLKEG